MIIEYISFRNKYIDIAEKHTRMYCLVKIQKLVRRDKRKH
jgi:hypothetical protein